MELSSCESVKKYDIIDVMRARQQALTELQDTVTNYYLEFMENELKHIQPEIREIVRNYITSKSPLLYAYDNRYYFHTVSEIRKRKNLRTREDYIEYKYGYIICAELQFVKSEYVFTTYRVKVKTTPTKILSYPLSYLRPDARFWRICRTSDELFSCLHDTRYYLTN
jgi:hypothetical protein